MSALGQKQTLDIEYHSAYDARMGKILSKLKRTFIVNSMASFYRNKSFGRILKHLPKPYSMKRSDEVLCNIFRILALKEMKKSEWLDEFDYLTENKMLEVFNRDTKRYLEIHLTNRLSTKYLWLNAHKVDILNVPSLIKKTFLIEYFPMNA